MAGVPPATDRTAFGGGINGHVWSNYLITINSNMENYAGSRARCAAAMEAAVAEILSAGRVWSWLYTVAADGTRRRFAPGAERDLVKWIRARSALEAYGNRNRAPHMHLYLEICHTTNVAIEYRPLMIAIRQSLEGLSAAERRAVNIDIQFVPANTPADKNFVLHYLVKQGVPARRRQAPNDPRLTDFARAMITDPEADRRPVHRTMFNQVQGVYPRRGVLGQGANQADADSDVAVRDLDVEDTQ